MSKCDVDNVLKSGRVVLFIYFWFVSPVMCFWSSFVSFIVVVIVFSSQGPKPDLKVHPKLQLCRYVHSHSGYCVLVLFFYSFFIFAALLSSLWLLLFKLLTFSNSITKNGIKLFLQNLKPFLLRQGTADNCQYFFSNEPCSDRWRGRGFFSCLFWIFKSIDHHFFPFGTAWRANKARTKLHQDLTNVSVLAFASVCWGRLRRSVHKCFISSQLLFVKGGRRISKNI